MVLASMWHSVRVDGSDLESLPHHVVPWVRIIDGDPGVIALGGAPALMDVVACCLTGEVASLGGLRDPRGSVVGVDVGGTNIEVGPVGDDHEVTGRGKTDTDTPDDGPEAVLEAIAALLEGLDGDPSAIGLEIPGVVHEGCALTVPDLPNWGEPVDLVSALTDRTGLPVVLGNDANVGLLGEWLAGAAAGARDVLGVWLGTGVGGGLTLDERPYLGARGAAGEVGHVVVRQGGQMCGCGRRGCVEAYAGRRSTEAAVAAQVAAGRPSSLDSVRRDKGKAAATSGVWEGVLEDGDEVANEVFAAGIDALGAGIGSVLNVLDVDLVVVGGGLVEKRGSDLTDRIGAATLPWVLRAGPDLRFAAAGLGDDSGVVGAAALARSSVIGG